MARLTVTTDLSGSITRQTLFNSWANANVTEVTTADLGTDLNTLPLGSSFSDLPSDPTPGGLFYHKHEQILYCFHDEIENTGVSLWLAIGPDVFETACLAAEPIPAGAVVEPWFDRWVKTARPSEPILDVGSAFIGVNQSGLPDPSEPWPGDTAASGTWIRVAIDGLPMCWFPKEDTGVSETRFGVNHTFLAHVGVLAGGYYDGGVGVPELTTAGVNSQIGYAPHRVTTNSGYTLTYARVKWGGGRLDHTV